MTLANESGTNRSLHALEIEKQRLIKSVAALEVANTDLSEELNIMRSDQRRWKRRAVEAEDAYATIEVQRDSLIDRLKQAFSSAPPCGECDGTGAQPITRETYSADRMEIVGEEFVEWGDPATNPCTACDGVGRFCG